MRKKLILFSIVIILISMIFCGCQEEATTTENEWEGIIFESDILEITNASFEIERGKDGIPRNAIVIFYFKNLLDKGIDNLDLSIEFCDENNRVMHSHPYYFNTIFPAGYSEYSPNRISYNGDNIIHVDHVNIVITNYDLVE